MKTFAKIFICIVVIILAVGIAYSSYYGENETATNTNTNNNIEKNEVNTNTSNLTDVENKDYVGEEEKVEPEQEKEENNITNEEPKQEEEQPVELRGKDKAVDIVKKQYALEGQTVEFDHMEGSDYIIKIKDGTEVKWWYLVNGTTWEAEEY